MRKYQANLSLKMDRICIAVTAADNPVILNRNLVSGVKHTFPNLKSKNLLPKYKHWNEEKRSKKV